VHPDAARSEGRQIACVGAAAETTRVTIDVEVGSEPISGQLDLAGKRTELFVGWSALAELLEEARTGMPDTGGKAAAPESATGGDR
jgi:hypothetical protein